MTDRQRGFALVLLSASGFASLAIFGKLAYRANLQVPEVLALRFTFAAPMLFAVAKLAGRDLRLPRGTRTKVLAMGAVGYAVQSTLFFSALSRIPAALTGLLLYLYPALVTIGAVALKRHRANRLTIVGLAAALVGTAIVIGRPHGPTTTTGIVLGVLSAFWYSGYILVGERVVKGVDPIVVSVYVALGAAASFDIVGGLVLRRLDFHHVGASAWPSAAGMALFGTALAITTFFAGMAVIGATWASIASSWEPVCTVILGVVILGDHLSPNLIVGGTLVVLGAVVLPLVRQ